MTNLFLDVSTSMVDWARAQFALTAIYHWLFVPLTLGLSLIMGIMETCYYRTGDLFWKKTSQFWQRLFGVNFAMGVATGIILEFEFGTNWSNYSWFVGDIFGAPLAIEGIIAFFMESTFVAVMYFGWNKVSKGFHLASTWLTGIGATISAWWILVANSWMQYPVGHTFNPETMRSEMATVESFLEVALSPFAVNKFTHSVTSAWVIGAIFVVAISSWYMLKKKGNKRFAVESMKIGVIVGLVASLLTASTGHKSAYQVAQVQPMKLAAMEALYDGGTDQSLTAVAWVNPFKQPDYATEGQPPLRIAIPNFLSYLATRDFHGYVPGVNDIVNGYTKSDGTVEPSFAEKIERGKQAIKALSQFRNSTDDKLKAEAKKVLDENFKYFGYGYAEKPADLVPPIPVNFWSFRIMVGMGMVLILFFIVAIFLVYKRDVVKHRWLHIVALALFPLTYIASEAGWLVAEFGRQPWTIQDMLPTWAAVSDLNGGYVAFTFFLFLILFTTLLIVELNILFKQIKKGPDFEETSMEG
ncbi:MAG: cytochrome ubiquinol oxidase subunit I [Prevotella sp.]|nr:cytochrome ubiquinol oxidase subunit I [Prevotella sp.]